MMVQLGVGLGRSGSHFEAIPTCLAAWGRHCHDPRR